MIDIIDAEQIEELQSEQRLFDKDLADKQRTLDRIAELIGLPHGQEIDATAFELWFDTISAPPAQRETDPDSMNDKRMHEDMTLAHNAREAAIEECARLIEENQEASLETSSGSLRHLMPRKIGNLMGLSYAASIRALGAKP